MSSSYRHWNPVHVNNLAQMYIKPIEKRIKHDEKHPSEEYQQEIAKVCLNCCRETCNGEECDYLINRKRELIENAI